MSGEIQIKTQVQIKTELILPNGEKLGEITPMIAQVNGTKITILHVELNKPMEPSDLKAIESAISQLKRFIEGELVILSGRMPVWSYVAIAHMFHGLISAVAVLDPKLQGAVIVMTHTRKFETYEVVKLPQELLEKLVQVRV